MSNTLDTPYGSINIYLQSQLGTTIGSSGFNNSKQWILNTPVNLPRPDVKMLCAVTDFQCAYSWYIIRENVNDFVGITINDGSGVYPYNGTIISSTGGFTGKGLQIPEGNYNANTFVTALNDAFSFATGGALSKFAYDSLTNKIKFELDTGANDPVSPCTVTLLNNDNDNTTSDTEIGIEGQPDKSAVLTYTVGPPLASISYPNMVDFAGIPYVYVTCPTLGLENRNSKGDIDLTLAKIPVTAQPLGFIFMPTAAGQVHLHLLDREIKKIQIVLKDDEGNDLDLHGIGWGLTMTIHFQYLRLPLPPRMILDTGLVPDETEQEIKDEIKE